MVINKTSNNSLKINDMLLDPIIIDVYEDENLNERALKKYILKELELVFIIKVNSSFIMKLNNFYHIFVRLPSFL